MKYMEDLQLHGGLAIYAVLAAYAYVHGMNPAVHATYVAWSMRSICSIRSVCIESCIWNMCSVCAIHAAHVVYATS